MWRKRTSINEARLAHTVPRIFAYDETFDVGEDTATPVGTYATPFRFSGTLDRLELRAEPPAAATPQKPIARPQD